MIILKAIAVMIGVTFACHLGLVEAISKVLSKIMDCSMCSTFWSCLVFLTISGEDPINAAIVSIFAAYVSNWINFVLIILQHKYDEIWQRLTTPKER